MSYGADRMDGVWDRAICLECLVDQVSATVAAAISDPKSCMMQREKKTRIRKGLKRATSPCYCALSNLDFDRRLNPLGCS